MRHVDIVKNEWLAGWQHVVAKAWIQSGTVRVDSPWPRFWENIVLKPYVDPDSGELIYAEKESDLFLERLHEVIHGTYLFATAVHADKDCPFTEEPVLPMRRAERQLA
jgi:hypothetical protein